MAKRPHGVRQQTWAEMELFRQQAAEYNANRPPTDPPIPHPIACNCCFRPYPHIIPRESFDYARHAKGAAQ